MHKKLLTHLEWVVTAAEEGMTLLAFLRKKYPEAPSVKALKRAIDGKYCTVDRRIETFSSHPLKRGMKVVLTLAAFEPEKQTLPLTILYEDDALLTCNKPAGLVSDHRSLNQQLPLYEGRLRLVHRLDKETSGALILAKNKTAEEAMHSLFTQRAIRKFYLALVDGIVKQDVGTIDNYLGPKARYSGQTMYASVSREKGKRAITHWTCLKRADRACLLLCELLTGRTHQLRAHLSGLGHPILGDAQYGKHFRCSLHPLRHLLHAYTLAFDHPFTGEKIEVTAPIPADFRQALTQLKIKFN